MFRANDEPLQEIVHDALKKGGFDLTTVASGHEAMAMIESGVVKYSALATDVKSQGIDEGLGDCTLGQANRSCIESRSLLADAFGYATTSLIGGAVAIWCAVWLWRRYVRS